MIIGNALGALALQLPGELANDSNQVVSQTIINVVFFGYTQLSITKTHKSVTFSALSEDQCAQTICCSRHVC